MQTVHAESIFNQYSSRDVSALCADAHLPREEAKCVVMFWNALEAAQDSYEKILANPTDHEAHETYIEKAANMRVVGLLLPSLPGFPHEASWRGRSGIKVLGEKLIKVLNPDEKTLLEPEALKEMPFEQFSDEDIVYAAQLKGYDWKRCLDAWTVIENFEDGDEDWRDVWPAVNDAFYEVMLKPTDDPEKINLAKVFLQKLGLVR